jgi:hypothetical protein
MTREVGVVSSHLQTVKVLNVTGISEAYLSVVPRMDSTSFLWMVLAAFTEPNIYIAIEMQYTTPANPSREP